MRILHRTSLQRNDMDRRCQTLHAPFYGRNAPHGRTVFVLASTMLPAPSLAYRDQACTIVQPNDSSFSAAALIRSAI